MQWLREKLIVKLGGYVAKGYPDAESAIAAITDTKAKRKILTLAVKRLFNTIGPEDILKDLGGGQWSVAGRPISAGERDRLIAEATNFNESTLWKVLKLDLRHQANRRMFLEAKSDDDLTAGKLWAFTVDAINTRLKSLEKGSAMLNLPSGQK